MTHSSPYSRYANEVTTLVGSFMNNEPLPITTEPGSRAAFIATADYLHDATIATIGNTLPQRLQTAEVRHGMRVMARTAYYAALRAEELSYTPNRLVACLIHPATFGQTLAPIASDDNEVSKRLEREFGLWGEADIPPQYYYLFEADGSISFGETSYLRNEIIAEKKLQPRPNAICGAHRAKALEPLYHNVMPLYASHAALGGAIIRTDNEQAA